MTDASPLDLPPGTGCGAETADDAGTETGYLRRQLIERTADLATAELELKAAREDLRRAAEQLAQLTALLDGQAPGDPSRD